MLSVSWEYPAEANALRVIAGLELIAKATPEAAEALLDAAKLIRSLIEELERKNAV